MTGEKDVEYERPVTDFSEEEMTKLDGTRVKVETVVLHDFESGYAIEDCKINGKDYKAGEELPADVTVPAKEFVVTTVAPLVDKELRVRERFSLKKRKKDGAWIASLHEKSKVYKALRKYNVNRMEELVGKDVILSKMVLANNKFRLGINLG
jgi:hypothetical protein